MTPTNIASTVGIELPADFPLAQYNGIHGKLAAIQPRFPEAFRHYGGAWNAVAFRHRAAAEADDTYREVTAKHSNSLNRYAQELSLFGFFTNAVSSLDSLAYGAHAIGSTLSPQSFLLTARALRGITCESVANQFNQIFPSDTLGSNLMILADDPLLSEMREVRNALSHRSASARTITLSAGTSSPSPERWIVDHLQLRGGLQSIVIDDQTTRRYRSSFSAQLHHVLQALRELVHERL